MKVVVADAGPLIIFARTCGIKLLKTVVKEILVPPAVMAECIADTGKPGADAVQEAIKKGLLTLLSAADASDLANDLLLLDDGEKEAIAAAKANRCGVLMDESLGRVVARKLGIPVTGSLGILLKAKESGTMEKIGPTIAAWRAANYFISDRLIAEALRRAGESTILKP